MVDLSEARIKDYVARRSDNFIIPEGFPSARNFDKFLVELILKVANQPEDHAHLAVELDLTPAVIKKVLETYPQIFRLYGGKYTVTREVSIAYWGM